jgi:predicted secreted protein
MMNRRRHFILLTALVALAGCAEPAVPEPGSSGKIADSGNGATNTGTDAVSDTGAETDAGGKGARDTYTVELSANGSTGFTWTYTMDPAGIVEEASRSYTLDDPIDQYPVKTGGPGTFSVVFKAIRPGTVRLHFEYKQSWTTAAPARTAAYTLSVDSTLKVSLAAQ